MNDHVIIHHELNVKSLERRIDTATALQDNEEAFSELVEILAAKKNVKDLLDRIEGIERTAKQAINRKARDLYGNDWQTIVSGRFKITRYHAGSIYNRIEGEKVAKKFLKIVESLDTEAINAHIEEKEELPAGLELNNNRTEVIKLTFKD